jgi:tetratricopeptide (TPR) repeat protein
MSCAALVASLICHFSITARRLAFVGIFVMWQCGTTGAKELGGSGTLTKSDSPGSAPAEMPFPDASSLHKPIARPKTVQDQMYDLVGPNRAHSMSELNNLIKLHPQSPELYLQRGHAYLMDGDSVNALNDFKKALVVDPKCAGAHIGISRVMRGMGNFGAGFEELHKAEQLGNGDVATSALWESAFVHRERKQMDIALEQYNSVIKRGLVGQSRQAFALFQRGELYLRINQLDKAIPDLNAAIKLEPNMVLARMCRSSLYSRINKPNEALADLNSAIATEKATNAVDPFGGLRGQLARLYKNRAEVYQKLGKNDLAQRDLKAEKEAQMNAIEIAPFQYIEKKK